MPKGLTDKARPGGEKANLGQRLIKREPKEGIDSVVASLSNLYEFCRKLSPLVSAQKVRQATVQGALEATGADLALFFIRQGGELICAAQSPPDSTHLPVINRMNDLGECLCGLAARDRAPIYSTDIQADSRCNFEQCKQAGLRSLAALPLAKGQDVLGVLALASVGPRDFSRESLFLEPLADQASTSLANALLFEQVNENNTYMREQLNKLNRAQLELKQSEERYRDLIENVADLISTHDMEGTFLSVNRAAETLLGYDPGVVVDQKWNVRDILAPKYRDFFDDYLKTIRQKGSAKGLMIVQNKSGEVRILEYSNTLRTEGVPEPIVRSLARDITERRRTEEALKLSEEAFSKAFQASPIWSTIATLGEGRFLEVNRAFTEITGYGRDEVISRTVNDINLWLDMGERDEAMELMGQKGFLHNHPVTWRFKDGSIHDLLWSTEYIAFAGKRCTLNVALDITEKKKAEEKLRNRERELRTLFEEALNPILLADEQGRYVDANQAALDFWECTKEDLLQKRIWDGMPHNMSAGRNQGHPPFKSCHTYENEYLVGNKVKTLLLNMVPLELPGRKIAYGIGQDITERKRLENQLRQSQKLEAMGTLAGGIAHDFNNVLAAILGFTEMVKEDLPEGHPSQVHLNQISRAGQRASDLVKQILSFSRPGDQEHRSLALIPLVKEAALMLRSSLPTTIEIRTEFTASRDTVMADATQIHQVLVNLCTNAAQSIEGTGTIIIRVAEAEAGLELESEPLGPGSYLVLSVQDDGCGMDQKTKERIFEPFFTTREVGKGTGMGLAVVHGIVKTHGGAVQVESGLGAGTTFKIYLPAVKLAPQERSRQDRRRLPRGEERILLVDDEPMLVDIGVKTLHRLGYQVAAYTSSEEALAEFRRRPQDFDALITDYTMPGLTGADLAKKVLEVRPELPVILCTGYSERISEETAGEIGIACFLLKPLLPKEIAQILRDILEGKSRAPAKAQR